MMLTLRRRPSIRQAAGVAAFACFVLSSGTPVSFAQQSASIRTTIPARTAKVPKNRHARLDSIIDRLIADSERRGERAAAALAPLSRDASVAIAMDFSGGTAEAAVALGTRGAIVANLGERAIEAYVPISALAGLEDLPGLLSARALVPPQPLVTSQGKTVHNATAWEAVGYNGTGVKVGIIDVGFHGYSALIGTEVPPPASVRCYTAVGVFSSNIADCEAGITHGTAVTEALYDMAPGVTLYLSQPMTAGDLLTTTQWMISQGVTVINHSVGWGWTGPGDGTSIYSDSPLNSVNAAVAGGSVWVNAVGRSGMSTWTGSYRDQDANNWLEFAPGVELNPVSLSAGQRIIVQMRWDDTWGGATRDLDLVLFGSDLGTTLTSSTNWQQGGAGDVPFEVLQYTAPASGTYYIAINRYSGSLPAWVQVQALSGETFGYFTASSSLTSPDDSANPGMLAVGATPWYDTQTIEPSTSRGPTLDGRVKPDLTAVDRADSVTFGPGGFIGTSQASAHVAGLAALVRQRYPALAPAGVAQYLKTQALPRGNAVPNNTWGWGLAYLPAPNCSYLLNPANQPAGAGGGPGSVAITADCPWTAVSNVNWLQVTGANSGIGNGVVSFTVASNVSTNTVTAPRTGTVTIGGATLTVTQAGCSFSLVETGSTFAADGGSGAVTVTAEDGCTWTVSGVPGWASTTSGSSGSGTGVWQFDVSTNSTGSQRAAVVSVAGRAFALTQLAVGLRPLVAGGRLSVALADSSSQQWVSLEMVAGRSYCVGVVSEVAATAPASPELAAFRGDGTTALPVGSTEGSSLPEACFIAPATETAVMRVRQSDSAERNYLVSAAETTRWSNWFFIGGDYSSFTLLRNSTDAPVAALVTWRDQAGIVVGQQTTIVPPRGIWARDAKTVVNAGATSGSVEVAHNGSSSAIVGSQTTLSAATGLSFDTLLRERYDR